MRRRLATIGIFGLLTVAALIVYAALAGRQPAERAAPRLPATVLVGPRATLTSLRGRPAIVTFWASWCGPCAHEASALAALARELHGRARIVGVSWSDSAAGARAFVRRYDWTFPNLRDANGAVGNRYGLQGLPTTFILDSHGRIARRLIGPQTDSSLLHALILAS